MPRSPGRRSDPAPGSYRPHVAARRPGGRPSAKASLPGARASPVPRYLERSAWPGGPRQRSAVLGSCRDDAWAAAKGRHFQRDEEQVRRAEVAWILQDHPLRDHRRGEDRLPVQPIDDRGITRRPTQRGQDPDHRPRQPLTCHRRFPRDRADSPGIQPLSWSQYGVSPSIRTTGLWPTPDAKASVASRRQNGSSGGGLTDGLGSTCCAIVVFA